MNPYERDEFAEQVAQAVIDRIEARDRVVRLADRAIERFRGQSQGTKEETSAGNISGAQENVADAGSASDSRHLPGSLALRRVILRRRCVIWRCHIRAGLRLMCGLRSRRSGRTTLT